MTFEAPAQFNIADYFLDDRIREGKGGRLALRTDDKTLTYQDVQVLANQFANVLRDAGVKPGERVIIALPDIPEFVGALFGILKTGAVVVMVNSHLKADAIRYFYEYTGATLAILHQETRSEFEAAGPDIPKLVVGDSALRQDLEAASPDLKNHPSAAQDPAFFLFSGGTTGQPKAVVQSHTSFAHTTECYAKQTLEFSENDITLSVPKLYFGYATGSNLLFPFSVGASAVLFPDRCTADVLFEKIQKFRPTVLINVPTMVNHLTRHADAAKQDFSSLRLSTSAGEALPVELYHRWKKTFGVELLDGLGTAEMWHIFVSNRVGDTKPGTLGKVVPGFELKVRNEKEEDVAVGDIGFLWVGGNSRAISYWKEEEKSRKAFREEWYISGDMIRRDADGYVTYCGRGDDMLKVGGKWLSPQEVENCLLQHEAVKECVVVGVVDANGLTKPHAYVVATEKTDGLGERLQTFVKETLEPYKYPREVVFLDALPRTHLGKIDRGRLRKT